MDTGALIRTLGQMYGILLLGVLLAKLDLLDAHVNEKLSSMVVTVVYPILLLCSMMEEPAGDRREALLLLGAGFALYAALIPLSHALTALLRVPAERRREFACMLVFGNTGFIGAPLARSLYGSAAFFQVTLLHFAFFFYFNFYAARALSGDTEPERPRWKSLFSPGLLVTMAAVALYLLRFSVPRPVYDALYMVGGMTTPLSMLILGASLAAYPLRRSLGDPWAYVLSLTRLLALPALVFFICRGLGAPAYYANLTVLTMGMPAGSMVLMLALQRGRDSGFISRGILISTLLSAATLPALAALFLR